MNYQGKLYYQTDRAMDRLGNSRPVDGPFKYVLPRDDINDTSFILKHLGDEGLRLTTIYMRYTHLRIKMYVNINGSLWALARALRVNDIDDWKYRYHSLRFGPASKKGQEETCQ